MSFVPSIYSQASIARINAYHSSSHGGLQRVQNAAPALELLGRDGHTDKLKNHLSTIQGAWVQDHRGTGMVVLSSTKRTPAEALRLLARRKEFAVLDRKQGRTVPLRLLFESLERDEALVPFFRLVHAEQTPEALLASGLATGGTEARVSAGVAMWLAKSHDDVAPSLRWSVQTAGTQSKMTLTLDPRGALRERLQSQGAPLGKVSITDCIDLGSGRNGETRALLRQLEMGSLPAEAQLAALLLDGCMAHDHLRSAADQQVASQLCRGIFTAQDQLVARLATEQLTNPSVLTDASAYFTADPRLVDFVADHATRHNPTVPWDWKPWQRLLR